VQVRCQEGRSERGQAIKWTLRDPEIPYRNGRIKIPYRNGRIKPFQRIRLARLETSKEIGQWSDAIAVLPKLDGTVVSFLHQQEKKDKRVATLVLPTSPDASAAPKKNL
jgi:hypothetical protein